MPTPHTKTRQALKARFVRGAIPTEADFSDLIGASLNQIEDGVIKLPNQPLSLVRQKRDQPVLRFFEDAGAASSAWQIHLAAEGRSGVAMTNKQGQTCLFIDQESGHVGLGTASPVARLTVHSDLLSTDIAQDPGSHLKHAGPVAIKSHYPQLDWIDTDGAMDWAIHLAGGCLSFARTPWKFGVFHLDGNTGNVGIGTDQPAQKLHVNGSAAITTLHVDEIRLTGELVASQSRVTISSNGNVGICETNPAARLTVSSDLDVTKTSKDPHSKLSYGGHLAIKAPTPQIDFLIMDSRRLGEFHWAIQVSNGKLSFVASPWNENVFVLDGKGNIGVGTSQPVVKLHVAGVANVEEPVIGKRWQLGGGYWKGYWHDHYIRLLNPAIQNFRTTTEANDFGQYGGFAAKSLWTHEGRLQGSDRRLKLGESIRPMANILPRLLDLMPVEFRFKTDPEERSPRLGFIAQEVEKVFPEAVEVGPDGMKGIDTNCIVALLAQALKEQQAEIDLLQAQIIPPP